MNTEIERTAEELYTAGRLAGDVLTARAAYSKALSIKPDHEQALIKMAELLYEMGDITGAAFYVDKSIRTGKPHSGAKLRKAVYQMRTVASSVEELAESMADLDEALADWSNPTPDEALNIPSIWTLAYIYGDHTERYRAYGKGMASIHTERLEYIRPADRIRVLFIAHLDFMSEWSIILQGILTHIDRTRFEPVLLITGNTDDEEVIRQAAALTERQYHEYTDLCRAVDIIKAEQPHIIFYPEIGLSRLIGKLSTMRLALVQCVSWGHPITTGSPEIDIYFSGELIESEDTQKHYTERLIKLPGTGSISLPPKPLIPIQQNANAGVSFLLCQMPHKYNPADDYLYVEIAKQVPGCQFWIAVAPDIRAVQIRLYRAFWDNGLDPYDYFLEFQWQSPEGFAGILDAATVYLDCPCFSGFTTARQAIQRGIPIVTLEGEYSRQRLAAGLLRQIEQTDTIARTREEYIAIAVRLARESQAERDLRRESIKQAAPLAENNLSVIRTLENALIDELMTKQANQGDITPE